MHGQGSDLTASTCRLFSAPQPPYQGKLLTPPPLPQPHWLGYWVPLPAKLLLRNSPGPSLPAPCSPRTPQAQSCSSGASSEDRPSVDPSPTASSVTRCPITQGCLPSLPLAPTVLLIWALYLPYKIYLGYKSGVLLVPHPLRLKLPGTR